MNCSIFANNRAIEMLFVPLERGGKVILNSKFMSKLLNYSLGYRSSKLESDRQKKADDI
jgi:hypothetical protein